MKEKVGLSDGEPIRGGGGGGGGGARAHRLRNTVFFNLKFFFFVRSQLLQNET